MTSTQDEKYVCIVCINVIFVLALASFDAIAIRVELLDLADDQLDVAVLVDRVVIVVVTALLVRVLFLDHDEPGVSRVSVSKPVLLPLPDASLS